MNLSKFRYVNITKLILTSLVLITLFRLSRIFGSDFLYSKEIITRTIGDQSELYVFTWIDAIVVILGSILYLKNREIRYMPILAFVVIVNILRYAFGWSNPIDLKDYTVFLSLLVSFSCCSIILSCYKTLDEIEHFMDVFITILFVTQLFMVVSGNGTSGSYGAVGVSGGGLALCYSTYIVFKLMRLRKGQIIKSNFFIILAVFIGVFLTGSRTHILLLACFGIYYIAFVMSIHNIFKWVGIVLIIAGGLALTTMQGVIENLQISSKISSLISLVSNGFITAAMGDASVSERFLSWNAAFLNIKNNPFGISCSADDLQTRMFNFGSTTFPHSYLMCYYLLLGIPTLIVYIVMWKKFGRCIKFQTGFAPLMLYIILVLTFYGGLSLPYIPFFWIAILFVYVSVDIKQNTIEEIYSEND